MPIISGIDYPVIYNGGKLLIEGWNGVDKIHSIDRITNGSEQRYDINTQLRAGYGQASGIFKDLVGNNDGAVINCGWGDDSLSFNGIDSVVEYAGAITNRYTLSGIFAIEHVLSLNQPRFIDGNNTTYPGFYLENHSSGAPRNQWKYSVWAQNLDQAFPQGNTAPNNKRVHIAYCYDGTKIMLYINGIYADFINTTRNPASRTYNWLGGSIASKGGYANRFMKGEICCFERFSRALAPREIAINAVLDMDEYKII